LAIADERCLVLVAMAREMEGAPEISAETKPVQEGAQGERIFAGKISQNQ
jgi:hypothetical protein